VLLAINSNFYFFDVILYYCYWYSVSSWNETGVVQFVDSLWFVIDSKLQSNLYDCKLIANFGPVHTTQGTLQYP
jgi:hypothetical protein